MNELQWSDALKGNRRHSISGHEPLNGAYMVLINWLTVQSHGQRADFPWLCEFLGLILTSVKSRFSRVTGITVEEAADPPGLSEKWRSRQEPLSGGETGREAT